MAPTTPGWKEFPVQVLRLPLPQKLIVAGTLVVAIAAAVFFEMGRNVPVEKAFGSAVVTAPEATLRAERTSASKKLMGLPKGARVNFLDPLASLTDEFTRVQYVTPQKNSKPGFIETASLGEWLSDEPVSAWTILSLSRPKVNTEDSAIRKYIAELKAYAGRFPKTPQSEQALLERSSLDIDLANRMKIIGLLPEEWMKDVADAKDALAVIATTGAATSQRNEVIRMQKEIAALEGPAAAGNPSATPQQTPAAVAAAKPPAAEPAKPIPAATAPPPAAAPVKPEVPQKVREMVRGAQAAWDSGDLNACERFAKQILALDPTNISARGFQYQVNQAREALKH